LSRPSRQHVQGASEAGTNLKVGGTGPEQKWGYRSGAKRRKFFLSCPSTFWL